VPHLTRRCLFGLALPAVIVTSLATPTRALFAQDVLDPKSAAHLRDQFLTDMDTVHSKVIALAMAIPEEKYSWRPSPGVRSVSEVLARGRMA
jgi:ABC-type enterochelin transport system permease subunit